ncbi:MAG: hypothetical protein Q8L09_03110 [Candidatus Moranbacteria bacterium]|nr:hypothetical protein [Candidatus Moranbacteria bacterium]
MIRKEEYKDLIDSLDIGASVAEQDRFLEQAKVSTPIFEDFIADKIDFVLGSKGSGKTSIFRLTQAIKDILLAKVNLHIITGVEPQGNAVFELFKKDFELFTESDFENFWKIYFVNLIYNDFVCQESFKEKLKDYGSDINNFISESAAIGIPQISKSTDLRSIVQKTINAIKPRRVKKFKGGIEYKPDQGSIFPIGEIEFENEILKEEKIPICITKLGVILEKLLGKMNLRIWILLDRLDIVFEHGSQLEFFALRGLLKAYESFQVSAGNPFKYLRIKIFLRNDILDFLLNPDKFKRISGYKKSKNLPALTHITSRATKTPLAWSKEEIQQLMLKRLFLSAILRSYNKTSINELNNETKRNEMWSKLFGDKIEQGDKKSDSLSWIYTRLSDSDQVTPRSAIDFLDGVIHEQRRLFNLNSVDQEKLFSSQAVKQGIVTASIEKYTKEIKNEYPKIVSHIEKLRGKSAGFKIKEFKKIFGNNYEEIILELEKIGLLGKIGDTYKVAFIFRAALDVHPQF